MREALALSEEQVAEAMGITKATVRAWETGRTAPRGRKREAYTALLLGAPAPEERTDHPPEPTPGHLIASSAPSASSEVPEVSPEVPDVSDVSEVSEVPEPQAQAQAQPLPLPQAQAQAQAATPPRPQAQTRAQPQTQTKSPARTQAVESAGVRPRAAAKRAARPPKAPAPAPAIAPGPARKGAPKQQERRKPVAAAPEEEPLPASAGPVLTPEGAFDALYAHAATGLVHQTHLLTGRRRLSREAVERAFQHAWQHWPEVAVDADPVGWVRAAAHEYALSPWHRLRRVHKHPDAPPAEADRRALLDALLELPPPYRRTVLLYEGLGLDLPETAAETEASTPAAANRLLHARTVLGQRVPELADPGELHRRLSELVAEAPETSLPTARSVRAGGERRARTWTRTVLGMTAVLIGVTGFTAATAPARYIPVNAPGETVNGVPVRGGPPKLGPEDVELRDKLRSEPNPGPERLVPSAE
ncbi:sigma factor-like helix-turn-helix DNA-binding protein [Streptomyces sp. CBMA291]|uniref:sigma factor-like helix-turn-helix DNA-binding protein n=1 Tax=Streptomyces sp. CBMA291 TaxID=1930279 RepID=UPI00397EE008